MSVSLLDLAAVAGLVQQTEPNPVGAAGRMLGLTPAEQRSVPAWAWWGGLTILAVGLGIYLGRSHGGSER